MPAQGRPKTPVSLWWLAVAAQMAIIFRFSALPGGQVPGRFGSIGHFGGYAFLGVLCALALGDAGPRTRVLAIAVLICSAYGITDEFHQSFVAGRSPDVFDWGVDTLGAAVGAILATLASRRAARRRPF
ncbi:MAG: VanZ family protein [Actinomycetota bacterium]|nr:VanZ family protein [Actinomycetota bacterium]